MIYNINYSKLSGTGNLSTKGKKRKLSLVDRFRSFGAVTIAAVSIVTLLSACGGNKTSEVLPEEPQKIEQTVQDNTTPEIENDEELEFSFLADRLNIEGLKISDYLTPKIEAELAASSKDYGTNIDPNTVYTAPDKNGVNTPWISQEEADEFNNNSVTFDQNVFIAPDGSAWENKEAYDRYVNGSKEEEVSYEDNIYTASDGTPFWTREERDEYERYLRDGDTIHYDDDDEYQEDMRPGYYDGMYYTGAIRYGGTDEWFQSKKDYEDSLNADDYDHSSDYDYDDEEDLKAGYYDGYYYTGAIRYGGTDQWFQSKKDYENSLIDENINNNSNNSGTNDSDYSDVVYESAIDGTIFATEADRDAYDNYLRGNNNSDNNYEEEITEDELYYASDGTPFYNESDRDLYEESLSNSNISTYSAPVETASVENVVETEEELYYASDGTPFYNESDKNLYEESLNSSEAEISVTATAIADETEDTYEIQEEQPANNYTYMDGGYVDNNTGEFYDSDGDKWASYAEYSAYIMSIQQEEEVKTR